MDKHICKQCGIVFKYCGACSFKTIYYHEEGFCSDECCTKYRLGVKEEEKPVVIEELVAPEKEPIEVVETVITEEKSVEVPKKEIPKKMPYNGKNKWDTRVVK